MKWNLVLAAAFAASSVFAVACEDDASSPSGPAPDGGGTDGGGGRADAGEVPSPGSGSAFCDKTLGVVVAALERCCTAEDKETPDYAVTHGIAAGLLPACRDALEASIAKGRVRYIAASGDACYAAYETTYAPGRCANLTQTYADPAGTSCREAFVGVGADGVPCGGNQDCQDGLSCVGYTKLSDGACKPPQPIGAACGPGRSDGGIGGAPSLDFGSHPACVAGARCDALSLRCVAAGAEGASCTSKDTCAEPLECKLGKCTSEALSEAGGPCRDHDDCKPAFYCERAGSTELGTCAAKKTAGGTCEGAVFVSECAGRCDALVGQSGTCTSFCGSP